MSQESQRVLLVSKLSSIPYGFPVKIPNQPFKQPENAVYGETFIMGGPEPIAIGGVQKGVIIERSIQMVQLTIWVPEGKGTKEASLALDKFKKTFAYRKARDREGNTYQFSGMQVFNPTVKAGWSCHIGRIPFHRDERTEIDVTASIL